VIEASAPDLILEKGKSGESEDWGIHRQLIQRQSPTRRHSRNAVCDSAAKSHDKRALELRSN